MMNIALFSDCYVPIKNGVVTSMTQLKDGLTRKGHRVVVVTVTVPGYTEPDPDTVLRVASRPLGLGTEQQIGFVNQRRVEEFLRRNNVELIHTHTEFSLGQSGKRAAQHLGLPLVHTTHTMWEDYRHYIMNGTILPARMVRFLLNKLVRHADVFIHPSVKAESYFRKLCPGKPSRVIPNGVDRALFQRNEVSSQERAELRSRYGMKADDFVVIFTGRIGKEKRVTVLLESLIPLFRKHPHLRLVYVGQGPSSPDLERIASDAGVRDRLVLTGFIPWEQMYRYYAMADLFATASLSEVHPMTLIEAAITGLPAVVREDESYMTLLRQGENGFLAKTDEEMTEKIDLLINDRSLLAQFAEASREISKMYSAESHVNNVELLYREVLAAYPKVPVL
jgi:1,2-diacylglycerol 3-alpha-glucosyltransferase